METPAKTGPAGDGVHSLVCTEVWGGNNIVDLTVEVPGFMGWVHSRPLQPATEGGDLYYLAVCSKGLLSRIRENEGNDLSLQVADFRDIEADPVALISEVRNLRSSVAGSRSS